jgi:hypothetical protein
MAVARVGRPMSPNFCIAATTIPLERLGIATMRLYPTAMGDDAKETETMQLETRLAALPGIRAFSAPTRCPHCGDWMVAPVMSEFVEGGEIRHHWECEACGGTSMTSITAIPLTSH